MTQEFVIALGRDALWTTFLLAAPLLAFSLTVGVLISIFQAVTQINEVTLTFVPKIIAVFVALAIFGPWMLSTLTSYAAQLLGNLATYAH